MPRKWQKLNSDKIHRAVMAAGADGLTAAELEKTCRLSTRAVRDAMRKLMEEGAATPTKAVRARQHPYIAAEFAKTEEERPSVEEALRASKTATMRQLQEATGLEAKQIYNAITRIRRKTGILLDNSGVYHWKEGNPVGAPEPNAPSPQKKGGFLQVETGDGSTSLIPLAQISEIRWNSTQLSISCAAGEIKAATRSGASLGRSLAAGTLEKLAPAGPVTSVQFTRKS